MSVGGAFGGARGYQPSPPDKGVFPLDHFGECKEAKDRYLACLEQRQSRADACRDLSRAYLECRMQRNLMAQQDLQELGFSDQEPKRGLGEDADKAPQEPTLSEQRRKTGFIAGMRR